MKGTRGNAIRSAGREFARRWSIALLLTLACGWASYYHAQTRCGGTERWFVKVGTDPDANLVDTGNQIPTTVAQLNALPQRRDDVPAGDNRFRLPEEHIVYRVSGRLVKFKNESDKDYHLIITDDSLRYTRGGLGTDGQETGTSFIAEIPRPDCVAGMQGNLTASSHFQADLVATRQKFEERFPNGKGADKDLGGIPVTLVGVAFYDRQHRQTGRARNGIELHPLLDIIFEDQAGGGAPPVTTTELLTNPGFEDGPTGWTGTTSDIASYSQMPAHGGDQIAWMGGLGNVTSETLTQRATIPADATRARFSFWLHIETEETTNSTRYDMLSVQVRSTGGAVLRTLAIYSNLDDTIGYAQKTFNLDEFIGRDVQVYLRATEDEEKATSFVLDDFALVIN